MDGAETETMFEVAESDGGTEYQEIPEVPESSTPETMGISNEHIDPVVKRKRRNRRKNKERQKYRICPPEKNEEMLMRSPREILHGPVVNDYLKGSVNS